MDDALKVAEVAQQLRVHPQTVYRLIWGGELPWINVGHGKGRPRIRIRQSAVERYLASRERGGVAA